MQASWKISRRAGRIGVRMRLFKSLEFLLLDWSGILSIVLEYRLGYGLYSSVGSCIH